MNCKACGNELREGEVDYCNHQSCIIDRALHRFQTQPKKKTRFERNK